VNQGIFSSFISIKSNPYFSNSLSFRQKVFVNDIAQKICSLLKGEETLFDLEKNSLSSSENSQAEKLGTFKVE